MTNLFIAVGIDIVDSGSWGPKCVAIGGPAESCPKDLLNIQVGSVKVLRQQSSDETCQSIVHVTVGVER